MSTVTSRRRADMRMLTWGNIALLSAGSSSGCPALAVQDPPILYELGLALSKMGEEIAPRLLWSNQRGLPFTRPRRGFQDGSSAQLCQQHPKWGRLRQLSPSVWVSCPYDFICILAS